VEITILQVFISVPVFICIEGLFAGIVLYVATRQCFLQMSPTYWFHPLPVLEQLSFWSLMQVMYTMLQTLFKCT